MHNILELSQAGMEVIETLTQLGEGGTIGRSEHENSLETIVVAAAVSY